jgi:glycosyltransferase involved in cell wall biosynthesis
MKIISQKKIIIDGSSLLHHRGVGSYVNSLISGFDKIHIPKDYHLIVFLPKSHIGEFKHIKKIKFIKRPFINKIIWDLILLPIYSWQIGGKLIHFTENTGGFLFSNFFKLKNILTLHDVSFLKSFELVGKPMTIKQWVGLYYRRWGINYFIKKSERIITISKFVKKDIKNELKLNNKKIKIIYNALSKIFFSKRILPQKKNILIITGSSNQKNFFKTLKFLHQSLDIIKGWKILVIGIKGVDTKFVKYVGIINREKLLKYYDKSKILLMPSLYESFSIPIIEALSRELLVVSSKFGATKEILKKFGIFYNPHSLKELRSSLNKAIKNKKYFNKTQIKRAKKYALSFNQETLAKETLKIYKEILQ